MALPFIVAMAAVLMEQGRSGPPELSGDESVEAIQARNRIREVMEAVESVTYQGSAVPASSFADPDGMDDLVARVQAMQPGELKNLHDRWEAIRDKLRDGLPVFSDKITKAIAEKWTGSAGSAAAEGITAYVDKSGDLVGSVQLIAEKVKIVRSAVDITKPAVQEAPDSTWSSTVAGWVPGPTWRLDHHRDEQYHDANVNVVRNVFYPAVREADTQVPLVPKPYNPIQDSTDPPQPKDPGYEKSGGYSPGGTATPSTGNPATPGADPASQGAPATDPQGAGQSTTPSGVDSSTNNTPTTPSSATPTTPGGDPTQNRPTTGTPGSGTPGSGSPGLSGTPGLSRTPGGSGTGNGTGSPGRSRAGTPGGAGGAAAAASGNRGAGTGRASTGTPGMGGMSPRNNGEDDKERKTKDYLINQRNGEELTGLDEVNRARTVPPVIGE
ncbi:hypothetical protein ACWEKT_01300 [Nocardia takedensis]